MRLYLKFFLIYSLLFVLSMLVLYYQITMHTNEKIEDLMGINALEYAKSLALQEDIALGLATKIEYEVINERIENVRKSTRYQYIIVMDQKGIQYSYPYPSGVGKVYKNGGEERVLTKGESYTNIDRNELISAIRGFAPVYYEGKQVGAILVGLLTDQVQNEMQEKRSSMELTLLVGLLLGIIFSYLLAQHIKKSMFNLEPSEITYLLGERELVFNSIDQAILSVDCENRILVFNKKAQELFRFNKESVGEPIENYEIQLARVLAETVQQNKNRVNEEYIFERQLHLIMNSCLMYNQKNEVVGVVTSFKNFDEARNLAYEITDYQDMIDSLRAQKHEFMNKLHVLGGLIQLGNTEEALEYVEMLTNRSKRMVELLQKKSHSSKLSAIILAKYHKFIEAKIDFSLSNDFAIQGIPHCISEEDLCTIIGNLLENSYEAIIEEKKKNEQWQAKIDLEIQSDFGRFEMVLHNNGPEITLTKEEAIYERNYSTKEAGKNQHQSNRKRGQGLYLVKQILVGVNGDIHWRNEEGVTWYVEIQS